MAERLLFCLFSDLEMDSQLLVLFFSYPSLHYSSFFLLCLFVFIGSAFCLISFNSCFLLGRCLFVMFFCDILFMPYMDFVYFQFGSWHGLLEMVSINSTFLSFIHVLFLINKLNDVLTWSSFLFIQPHLESVFYFTGMQFPHGEL